MNDTITQVKPYIIYLPLDQHTELKVYAAKKNTPMSKIIIELITNFLKEKI